MNLFDRRRILASIGGIFKKIVSGSSGIVNYVTNVVMPTKITCEFSPVQSGTGDPSPDNVRPISGWAGCKIGRNGNNFLKVASGSLDTGGIVVTSDGENITITGTPTSTYGFIFISGDQLQYATSVANAQSLAATFSDTVLPVGRFALTQIVVQEEQDTGRPTQLYIFYKSGSYVNIATGASPSSASLTENAVAYALRVQKSTTYNGTWKHALGLGSERPEYETYNGDTLSVNWADDAGTVYGGTLTLNEDGSADLVAEAWATINYNNSTPIARRTNGYLQTINGVEYGRAYVYTNSNLGWIPYKPVACYFDKLPIIGRESDITTDWAATVTSNGNSSVIAYCIKSSLLADITTSDKVKESIQKWLADNQVHCVCKTTGEATTYHFSSIGALNSFIGANSIWHDMNGTITVEYYKKD